MQYHSDQGQRSQCEHAGLVRTNGDHYDQRCDCEKRNRALIALLPLSSELHLVYYNTTIWGTVYNYNHPIIYQFFEFRYFPLLASVLFLAAALILQFGRRNHLLLSKMIFAAAAGPFGFSLFRLSVFQGYRTNLIWMDFWEEVTEFIFILGVISVLWFFRRPLFKRQSASDVADPA